MTVKGILYRLITGMSQDEYDTRSMYNLTESDKLFQKDKDEAMLRDSCEIYEFVDLM